MKRVLFYSYRWYEFDNFSSFRVHWNEIDWMTAEHAYQAAKFTDPVVIEVIKNARSAHDAKKIARAHDKERRPDWDEIKLSVMESILRAKLHQYIHIQKRLLATDGAEIVEDSSADSFWGCGPDGKGLNHCGKIWMKLRGELIKREEFWEYFKV